jgi:hypothetical protein
MLSVLVISRAAVDRVDVLDWVQPAGPGAALLPRDFEDVEQVAAKVPSLELP